MPSKGEIALWTGVVTTALVFHDLVWTGVCTIWHPTWTILTNAPYVFFTDPLFQTGNTYLDGILALAVYAVTAIAIFEIFIAFTEGAARATEAEERHPRTARKVHWKALKYLVIAAVVITLLVNVLRYEHRQMKLKFFELLGEKGKSKKWLAESTVRKYLPGFLKTVVNEGFHPYFYSRVPRPLLQLFPTAPADSSRVASVWGYFKLLVENPRSLWWTRQWFTGWVAWCLYVRIECRNRDIDRSKAIDFMWLGYTTSLAGAQCLFFAFLLLHPRQHKSAARLATWPVLSFAMVEGVLIVLVSLALRWDERSRRSWPSGTYIFFSVIQGLLIAIPLIAINSAALVANAHSKDRAGWHRLRPKSFWHALSVFSIILHVYSTYVAFAEANGSSWVGKSNGWAGQLNWFVPWRDESHEPIQELRHIGVSIFKALGDHPWINALGWDVLLSAVVLCFWSVLSSTDARDMIRCSLLPALADGASQFEEARSDRGRPSRGAAGRQSSRTGKHAKLRQDAQEPGRSASRGRASSAPHTADGSDEGQWYSALTKSKPWRPLFLANGTPRIPHAGRAEEDQSLWSQHQEAPGEAEAAGLTWCLWVLGGLGTASAAVLGANQHEI